jgi:hypothetical protein
MADAIWNNRFILADPGKNETVLWSGNNVTPSSTAIVVSEALSNFNSVKFYWTKNNYLGEQVDELSIDGNTSELCFIHLSGVANMWIQALALTLSGTSLTLLWAKNLNFGSVSSTTWSNPTITTTVADSFQLTKIVGINRVSGGN